MLNVSAVSYVARLAMQLAVPTGHSEHRGSVGVYTTDAGQAGASWLAGSFQ